MTKARITKPRAKTTDGIAVHCAHDDLVDPKALTPYPGNPNTHPPRQIELLAKIIQQTGWRQPITVSRRSDRITKGHGRLAAAFHYGAAQVPVEFQAYPDEATERADLVADNVIAELAEMDSALLKDHLLELDTGAFDMDLTGFDRESLEDFMTRMAPPKATEDPTPNVPPPSQAKAKPGHLYRLGNHTLLCGDATRPDDWRRLAPEPAAAAFIDPPYGVSAQTIHLALPDYDIKLAKTTGHKKRKRWEDILGDDLRDKDLAAFLTTVFGHTYQNTTEAAAFYICYAFKSSQEFKRATEAAGLTIRQQLIWIKHMVLGRSHYHWSHEPILYCSKDKMAAWHGDRTARTVIEQAERKDVLELSKDELLALVLQLQEDTTTRRHAKDAVTEYKHPTQKPVALPFGFILNSTKAGDTVVDPCAGSGVTMSACQQAGRRALLMEKAPEYCDVIIKRYAALAEIDPAPLFNAADPAKPKPARRTAKPKPARKKTAKKQ